MRTKDTTLAPWNQYLTHPEHSTRVEAGEEEDEAHIMALLSK